MILLRHCFFNKKFNKKRVAFIGTPIKNFNSPPKRLLSKKIFGQQQNLTISVNLYFNPNHKMLPKFLKSIIKIMKKT